MRQLLSTLRRGPAQFVGVFVALVAAATIVTWAFSVGEAGSNSTLPPQRLRHGRGRNRPAERDPDQRCRA